MTKEQMDTDGFTGHENLHRVAKRRFRRAAEDFMRIHPDDRPTPGMAWDRLRATWEALERTR